MRQILNSYNVTHKDFDIWLKYYLRGFKGSEKEYAEKIGISFGELAAVLQGWKPPSKAILNDMKLKPIERLIEKNEFESIEEHRDGKKVTYTQWVVPKKYKITQYRQIERSYDDITEEPGIVDW